MLYSFLIFLLVVLVLIYFLIFHLPKAPKYRKEAPHKKITIFENDSIPFRLLVQSFKQGELPAYWVKKNGVWTSTSWNSYTKKIKIVSRSLLSLGIKRDDKICILSKNRPEWCILCLGSMCIGCIPVGIYQSSSSKDINFIIEHCDAKIICVEDKKQFLKLEENIIKKMKKIIILDEDEMLMDEETSFLNGKKISNFKNIINWKSFQNLKSKIKEILVDESISNIKLDDPAVFIYTVTGKGDPKGSILSHRNISFATSVSKFIGSLSNKSVFLSYLPLAHIAEQIFSIHLHVTVGYQIYFTEDREVFQSLKQTRPTAMFAVPRVWEKIHDCILNKMHKSSIGRYILFMWSMNVAKCAIEHKNAGYEITGLLGIKYSFVKNVIFPSIKEALGFGRIEICVSGGAPIDVKILEFFAGLDIQILDVYGLSETSGIVSTNKSNCAKFGSVGMLSPQTELKFNEENEILIKSPTVFSGYYKSNKNNVIDKDGYLHTGDLGRLDEDGYLWITGRKKNIVITSGGKNISPENIENQLKYTSPLISDACVIADKRKFLTCLISLNMQAAHELAAKINAKYPLHSNKKIIKIINTVVKKVNTNLGKVEKIKKFRIVLKDYISMNNFESSIKRREEIEMKYSDIIESMYSEEDEESK